jgi:nitrous oxide reductase accessory protein NosL
MDASRRGFLSGTAAGLALHPLAALLAGCGRRELPEGVAAIKWDRDTCVRCNMIISDPRFAAQVRGGPQQQSYKFDDIGCVVFWLKAQAWGSDPETRIWVMSASDNKWIDARAARYVGGRTSPMGYNFAATGGGAPGSLDFEDMRQHVLAKGK